MNTDQLAKRLKALRAHHGMSQEFLAEEAKVSLRTIQRIEGGESSPMGETVKRIAVALDVSISELVGGSKAETDYQDLTGTIILFKKLLSKTKEKSEIQTFNKFIILLTNIKNKELTIEQNRILAEYLNYLELEKIPTFKNDLFKKKLREFIKFLKSKMKFVPSRYYTTLSISLVVPFAIGFLLASEISILNKLMVILPTSLLIAIGLWMDIRIKKQNRALDFEK